MIMSERKNTEQGQGGGAGAAPPEEKVKAMKDFTSPDALHDELMGSIRKYHPSTDLSLIEKAFQTAESAHGEQLRKSGEPYIVHPLCVAIILADLELDKETIAAGLLHDVVEDTKMTFGEVGEAFGQEVALLVDGVTKLSQLSLSVENMDKLEIQAENLKKMFLAMAKDIRVILIKLADRLHNMRTLKFMRPDKQVEIARETLDIYAPLAQRLGISKIKVELDDLSLRYLDPAVYYDLVEKISIRKSAREDYVKLLVDEVGAGLEKAGLKAIIDGRAKHFFSVYRKMVNQGKTIDQIYDLFAVRIIVKTIPECYAALGVIHEMYKPVYGRFKDYISIPKLNMYQSLHTTVMGPKGQPFEIQIRTEEMHKTAEFGIAAHWKYKEASNGKKVEEQEEEKLSWLRNILEWQRETLDNREFMNLLKNDLDLFSDSVFCFTPNGDVKNLPAGSTPIDFAYNIHSAVGNTMIGAKVNGRIVPNDYTIQNGDRVEIQTSQNSRGPSLDWLKIVRSTQAKNKINQWFKQELKEDNITRGKELLAQYCKAKNIVLSDLMKPQYLEKALRKYGFRDWDSLLAAVGHGGLKEGQIINRLQEEQRKTLQQEKTDEEILKTINESKGRLPMETSGSAINVRGFRGMSIRLSKCCVPIPGDEIIGFITRGRGISVHRTDCKNILNLSDIDKSRLCEVEWPAQEHMEATGFLAELNIYSQNRTGLLADITRLLAENDMDITHIHSVTNKQNIATMSLSFQVKGKEGLAAIVKKLKQMEGVIDVKRTAG